jgi:predicted nucleotidyltransferase
MVPKWNCGNTEKESDNETKKNTVYTIRDILSCIAEEEENQVDISKTIDDEIKAMIKEEIKNAVRELVEEQKMVIRAAVEENKKIIREVLEQEIGAIQTKEDHIRESLLSYRMVR